MLLTQGLSLPDRFEPNNLQVLATNAGVIPGVHLSNLTIDNPSDRKNACSTSSIIRK